MYVTKNIKRRILEKNFQIGEPNVPHTLKAKNQKNNSLTSLKYLTSNREGVPSDMHLLMFGMKTQAEQLIPFQLPRPVELKKSDRKHVSSLERVQMLPILNTEGNEGMRSSNDNTSLDNTIEFSNRLSNKKSTNIFNAS